MLNKTTQKKKRLRTKADKLFYQACIIKHGAFCELCGSSYQLQVHHFFPKGQYSALRYDLDNGIVLCRGCHFRLHHADISLVAEIVKVRKLTWYDRMHEKAQKGVVEGSNRISWYIAHIESLTALISDL